MADADDPTDETATAPGPVDDATADDATADDATADVGPPVATADGDVDSVTVGIAAPPEAVYDLVADVTRMGEWSPECYSCRWFGRTRGPEVGARFVGFNKRGLLRWATTCEVVEADRGRAFVFRTRESNVRWGYRLEPDGDGTRVTELRDRRHARRGLLRVTGALVGGSEKQSDALRAGMGETLVRLKAVAEADAAAS